MKSRTLTRAFALCALTSLAGCAAEEGRSVGPVELGEQGEAVRYDRHGAAWYYVGPTRDTFRMDALPTLTDEDIAAIDGLKIEREAIAAGILSESPSGQPVDQITGAFISGAIMDDDDGEWATGPLDPTVVAGLIEAYEAERGVEDPHAEGDIEEGADTAWRSVFGSDGRNRKTPSQREDFPFSAMLNYLIPLSDAECAAEGEAPGCARSCTATLIDDTFATTNAHCVYSRSDDAWIYGDRNLANGRADRGEVCSELDCVDVYYRFRSPDYDDGLVADFTHDYALLELNNALPNANGTLTMSSLTSSSSIKAKRHYNYGYPGDKSPSGLWGMGCDINYVGDGRLGYKCDTSSGHSGGPVYYRNGNTRYQTAIHAGRAAVYNTGPMMGEIRGWMLSKM